MALNCHVGVIARRMGLKVKTGTEKLTVSKLLAACKCPAPFFADVLAGTDRALNKQQAATMLGIKTHALNVTSACRGAVVPVVRFGTSRGYGHRYSRRVIEAQLAFEMLNPLPVKKPNAVAKPRKRTVKHPQPVQPMQNETQPVPS